MQLDFDQLAKELFHHANALTAMPLMEWLTALHNAEDAAPFTDPTFFRKYMYSKKPEALKTVLEAAIGLKTAILKVQPMLLEELQKELNAVS